MSLAFEQAKINLGSTKTNPSVGCIVEKNGAVTSSGYTSLNGRPHAEFNALNKRKNFKMFLDVMIKEKRDTMGKNIKGQPFMQRDYSIYDNLSKDKQRKYDILMNAYAKGNYDEKYEKKILDYVNDLLPEKDKFGRVFASFVPKR